MTHPNDMTAWPEVRCQRGHPSHSARWLQVRVGGPTPYEDYTPIPRRLGVGWSMRVWDQEDRPGASGYCPADDCVSETILALGVWEPRETTLALHVLDSAGPGALVLDFGAQVGWFSLLALAAGATVAAWEADAENAELLRQSAAHNEWQDRLVLNVERVGPETAALRPQLHARLAKVDVEGAEGDVVRVLWPLIEAGLVDHLLVEVTPLFAGYYGELCARVMDAGYEAFVLPPKRVPPVDLADPAAALEPYRLARADVVGTVNGWEQEMVWFKRLGEEW